MSLVEFTKYLVQSIVSKPEEVTVEDVSTEDGKTTILVTVSEEDMSLTVGKGGKNANAIRNLVQASSNLNDTKLVKINIESK